MTPINETKLLELAAKAAGHKVIYACQDDRGLWVEGVEDEWNPINDNDQALDLAVDVLNWPFWGRAFEDAVTVLYACGQLPKDRKKATRLAIVFAVAEIGRKLP